MEVMATLGAAAGINFERELLEAFVRSASVEGLISPVDVAIGTLVLVNLAERTNTQTLRLGDYKFAGGSTGVLATYLQDCLALYPDLWRQELLKLLLELIDLERDQRVPEGRTLSFLTGKSMLPRSRLFTILNELAAPQVCLLERIDSAVEGDPHYRLPHERLIPAIRLLSGSILAQADRVRLILDTGYRTWMRFNNPKYLLSGSDLRLMRNYIANTTGNVPELTSYFRSSVRHQNYRLAKFAGGAFCVGIDFTFDAQSRLARRANRKSLACR